MKRSALLLAFLLALPLSMSACSDQETPAAAPAPTLAADRFQTLWTGTTELINGMDPEAERGGADADNAAAGVDQSSPLHFVDTASEPQGGHWCIESEDDTYVAFTYGSGESAMLMGDGRCDYDIAAATVVGDFVTGEWTHGGDLMGDVPATGMLDD